MTCMSTTLSTSLGWIFPSLLLGSHLLRECSRALLQSGPSSMCTVACRGPTMMVRSLNRPGIPWIGLSDYPIQSRGIQKLVNGNVERGKLVVISTFRCMKRCGPASKEYVSVSACVCSFLEEWAGITGLQAKQM